MIPNYHFCHCHRHCQIFAISSLPFCHCHFPISILSFLFVILQVKRKELDDPQLLSTDIVLNLLLAFRDVQDYDGMVELFESASALR